eukprot:GEMP01000044.1.p1 GENE.GEMP01000044.1~~GEMP01000044.1.p1  ORF type:complete len:2917 (-),score=497.20 GEMP01000044.1:3906-12656(-)
MLIIAVVLFMTIRGQSSGASRCFRIDNQNADGDDAHSRVISKNFILETGRDLAYQAVDSSSATQPDFYRIVADRSVLAHDQILTAAAGSAMRAQSTRIGLELVIPALTSPSAALNEVKRVADVTMKNVQRSSDSLLHAMSYTSDPIPDAFNPHGRSSSLQRFAGKYHESTAENPAVPAIFRLTGVSTFFFIFSIVSLINAKKVDQLSFDSVLRYLSLIPLGLGVLDDVLHATIAVQKFLGFMTVIKRIILTEEVGSLVSKMLLMHRIEFMRFFKMDQILGEAAQSAVVGLMNVQRRLATWLEPFTKSMDLLRAAFLRFKSWIAEQARDVPFALSMIRSNLASLTRRTGEALQGLGTLLRTQFQADSMVMHHIDALLVLGEKTKELATRFAGLIPLQLDIPSARMALSNAVDRLATLLTKSTLYTMSARLAKRVAAVFEGVELINGVNRICNAANAFRTLAISFVMAPFTSGISISLPRSLSAISLTLNQKFSQFALAALGQWERLSRAFPLLAKTSRLATNAIKTFTLKSAMAKLNVFMERAMPFLVVFDLVFSVWNLVSAIKEFDLAKLNPDMMELATANLCIATVGLIFSIINAALVVALYLANAGIIAASAATIGLLLGVFGIIMVVFLVVAMIIMHFYMIRAQRRQELTQFHQYTTTLARQLEHFMTPRGTSPTTFTVLDVVFNRRDRRNMTQLSFLPVKRLVVNEDNYLPTLADGFVSHLMDGGKYFSGKYDAYQTQFRQGTLTTVVLPLNIYTQPAEHKCQSRRRLTIPLTGPIVHSLLQSQRDELAKFFAGRDGVLFMPKDTPRDTIERWMEDGNKMVKHNTVCNEDNWLTYSEVIMPKVAERERQMRLVVNTSPLTIITPATSVPETLQRTAKMTYHIQINGPPSHSPPSLSNQQSVLQYTLSIPYGNSRNEPDFSYVITHNSRRDVSWTIELFHWLAIPSLRWDGESGLRQDIAAFCISDHQSIHHEWKAESWGVVYKRSLTIESANDDHALGTTSGFIIKRGNYQFTVDASQKKYQMIALTFTTNYEPNVSIKTIMAVLLDLVQGYRASDRTINNYTRGAAPFRIYIRDASERPDLYFNPYDGSDRSWSFFCPRWHHEHARHDFTFDCVNDDLLPDHVVHSVEISPRGLNVTFDFPELSTSTTPSTICIFFPTAGIATLISVRCENCDRTDVQRTLKSILLNAKNTKGLTTSLILDANGLYIERVGTTHPHTRFYHPAVDTRYEPFDATKTAMVGYFAMGDCFVLRDRYMASAQGSIRIYRAAGVTHGTVDTTLLRVEVPDASRYPLNSSISASASWIAVMKMTNDLSCPVQAATSRGDEYCVTCLDITLVRARSFPPFQYPDFNKQYVDATRPVEFTTTAVQVQSFANGGETWTQGVLLFQDRVFPLPVHYRFMAYWDNLQCAAFIHTESGQLRCHSAFSDNELATCISQQEDTGSECLVISTDGAATFDLVDSGDVSYIDELHLRYELDPQITFACTRSPKTYSFTTDYVTISSSNHQLPELPTALKTMATREPLLYVEMPLGSYFYDGCHFNVAASDADASTRESLVRVVSRHHGNRTESPLHKATFVHISTGQLFRLANCTVHLMPGVFIGSTFGTIASTMEDKAVSVNHKGNMPISVLEQHLESSDDHLNVTVPYISGFAIQQVTLRADNEGQRVQFVWDEFDAIPVDTVRLSIFIPPHITQVGHLPTNSTFSVKTHHLDYSEGDMVTPVLDAGQVSTASEYEENRHDHNSACGGKCQSGERCVANSVCFDPTHCFTRHYPRVLDTQFLPAERSHLTTFYCIVRAGIKHCQDKRLLYTILGMVLADNDTPPEEDTYIILHHTRTEGVICLCGTLECEIDAMERILDNNDFECNFVVRPLALPTMTALLPDVFRAYRLFPEPDALSARGRVGHARIELSHLSGSSDSIIQRNVDKYREFVSDNERDMLGCSAQRIAFAESVERGVFVQVTSTCAVHAHEENQVPAPQYLESFPEKYVPPFLNALFDHLRTGNLDIRANDLVDIARSLLRFAVHAVRHNYDLTALSPWDFFCSIYLDAVGRYIYYDPLGGVSFFAYHKLEKTGAANVENILIWVRTLLHSVMGAVAVQDSIPITVYDAQDELRSALEKLVSTHVANVTVLEQNIASLEVVLSSFPRLLQCDVPVNARLAAEHTAVTRFLHTGEVVVTSITERNVEVFAFGESYARPDGRDGMFLDAICPIKVVTLQVCTRSSRDSQIGTITNVTLRYDVSHSHQRDAPNIITTLDTLESCSLCPKVLTCATGSRRVSSFHQCQCVQCRDEYVHISTSHEQCLFAHFDYAPRGAWLHTRSMAVVSNSIWFDVSGLTDGPLYSRATRMPCASSPPACSYWNCAYDATIFPRAPSCFVRQDENPPVTTTLSNEVALLNMPTALTLHANLTGCLETSELPFPGAKHQFVGHYRQMNDWRNGYPVWRKIEPPSGNAGILPHSTCANHYLVYKKVSSDESYWAFACTVDDIDNDNDQLKPYPSDHGAPNLLPVLGGYFSPGFVVSVRQVHKCCDLVVVRALSKNDQCVSAATYHTTNMYQTYILQKGASTKTYLSVDGNFTLEQFMFDGATHWKLMMASEELMKWRVYSHEEEDFTSCVERQSDGAAYTGLKVECLLVHLELTANGTPLASLTESNMDATWCSANTHSVDRCHEARPEYKVEDWGLTQPGSWCQWVCDNLWATRQCMAYKGAPPWCYLWMSRESSSGPVDFVQSSLVCPVLQAVSPNENVPQSCNPHDVFANGVLRRSIVQLGKLLHELRNTDATTGAAELSAFKRLVNGHDAAAEQYLEELAAVITQRGVLHNHVPNLRYISFIPVHSCLRHDSSKCLESRDSDTDCCAAPSDMGCASGYYLYLGEPGCGRDLPGVHSTCCEPPSLLFHSDVIAILAFIKQLQRDSTN